MVAPWLAQISSTSRARFCAVLPETISALDLRRHARGHRGGRQAEIGRAHDLALADRDAALDLGEIFAEPDADDQLFDLGEQPGLLHALGIGGELAHRLDIGREPGEAMGGALLAVEQARDRPPLQHHPLAHLRRGVRQQRLDRPGRGARQGQQAAACGGTESGLWHGDDPE